MIFAITFALLLALFAPGNANPRLIGDPVRFTAAAGQLRGPSKYSWSEEFFSAALDHFAFTDDRRFSLRYFINVEHYKPSGPILFYTGNEGALESFAENTGFMWELAPRLNACVVFAEHRFYGKSQPFMNQSYHRIENLGYLSSEQALADFVELISFLKKERVPDATNSAVIAFGGSYGGMLSAWIRVKYPHVVDGAIAASAPVFWFTDSKIPDDIYDAIVTRAFIGSGCNRKAIEKGWFALENLAQTEEGRDYLNKLFKLEHISLLNSPEDVAFLKQYVREVMEAMAMVNYPYPTSFLSSLPGWPVKAACRFAERVADSERASAEQLYNIANLYYNYTGETKTFCANSAKCESAFAALGDPLGWPFQTCTEMVMPLCGSGWPNDFFWKDCPFTVESFASYCTTTFGPIGYKKSLLRPQFAGQNYGASQLPTATNIVFSNGYLDPWSGGGYSKHNVVSGTVISVILKQGAHHYDLRGSDPADTDEVRKVREVEETAIRAWIEAKRRRGLDGDKPRKHSAAHAALNSALTSN